MNVKTEPDQWSLERLGASAGALKHCCAGIALPALLGAAIANSERFRRNVNDLALRLLAKFEPDSLPPLHASEPSERLLAAREWARQELILYGQTSPWKIETADLGRLIPERMPPLKAR